MNVAPDAASVAWTRELRGFDDDDRDLTGGRQSVLDRKNGIDPVHEWLLVAKDQGRSIQHVRPSRTPIVIAGDSQGRRFGILQVFKRIEFVARDTPATGA